MSDMHAFAQELMQTKLMLQKYMEENETLRTENVFLYSQNDLMQRQFEDAMRENEAVGQCLVVLNTPTLTIVL